MPNDYYNHGSFPTTGSAATSANMRTELDSVMAGFNKLPTLTGNANKLVVVNSTGTALESAVSLQALAGGTGQTSYTIGDLLYASGSTTLSKLADVATGNALISGGIGVAPSWGKIGLTTHVSGSLPAGNGGTGSAFFTVAGPDTSIKTFTFPNSSATVLTSAAAVTPAQGGTGLTSYAIGDLIYASGSTTLAKLADVATGNVLVSGGVGVAPAWAQVGLSTHVTGILPTANGGTNSQYFGVSGPTNARTYTFPDSNAIMLSDAAPVTAAQGGTGIQTYTVGDLLYASGSTTLAKLADVATGNTLISGGVGVAPSWGKINLTTHVSGALPAANGGTGETTFTDGQIMIGNTAGGLTKATLTAGTNVTITNGNGSITIAATGGGGGGSGTVTSVDMSVPSILSISGNPITTSGTLALTYSGTALPAANGGTSFTSYAAGDLIYASAINTLAKLTAGTSNQVLTISASTGLPTWQTSASGMVYPGAGIPNSTGSAWGTSYTTSGSGTVVALATGATLTTPTTSGNVTATGTGARFLADFDNGTVNDRFIFQTSGSNANTGIYAIPNGSAVAASWQATNNSDTTNASKVLIATNGSTDVQLVSTRNGSGTFLPLSFLTGGSQRMQLDTSGNLNIGTSGVAAKMYVSGNAAQNLIEVIDGGSAIGFDFATGNNFTITLLGNRNLAAPTGVTVGQSGVIYIVQDATGSRTLSFNSVWHFSGGTAPSLTTTGSAVDVIAYTVRTASGTTPTSIAATLIANVK